ncbi:MAG: hypothetical protein LBC54_02995 [Bacteroidales bacterium OttesenSCG-928-I14]|jgi:hypothetical protein|nr:hypothetical protein [Bacteroidales bacterium OttesenSCG-928-I14]
MIDYSKSENSIVNSLESKLNPLEGIIKIEANQAIMELIGTKNKEIDSEQTQEYENFSKFHIQILIPNISNTTHAEALSKQKIIKKSFPDLPIYLIYESPNWKLLIGNFLNWKDAVDFKEKFKRKNPKFEKEIHVIADTATLSEQEYK